MTKPICTIPECTKEAHTLARGWCINHDRRWKQYGDPLGGRAAYGGKDPICIIPGCEKPESSRGWCAAHYNRWRLHGDPLAGRMPEGEAEAYFWKTVGTERPGECLVWPYGLTERQYGRFQSNGVRYLVHVLACERAHGPRPAGLIALHAPIICHTPACYSAEHVHWGSPQDNMDHRKIDGTMLYGEQLTHSKLTEADVRAIRSAREAGVSRIILAEKYGVHAEHIGLIARGGTWKHLL